MWRQLAGSVSACVRDALSLLRAPVGDHLFQPVFGSPDSLIRLTIFPPHFPFVGDLLSSPVLGVAF